MADIIDLVKTIFIDSKSIEVCRPVHAIRCSMGNIEKALLFGYCASQLQDVCGLSGVIHSFDLIKVGVYDIHYLKDVKLDYSNNTVIGNRRLYQY